MHRNFFSFQILFCALLTLAILVPAISITQQAQIEKLDSHSSTHGAVTWVNEAETLARKGEYGAALPLYEKAISALSPYPAQQQALRYRYGIVLNALGAKSRPDLYPLARAQFKSVLNYLDSGAELPHSAARVRSAMAHTYHRQAASEETITQRAHLLNTAYLLYKSAINGLSAQEEWHNLAITYFNIGQVCEWQGNLEEAIAWLEKAVQLDLQYKLPDLKEDADYLATLRQQVEPIGQNPETTL
ncbi:tetratricopeptide repeat protein [Microbulbifer sp. MLAF003]|uniref:tetratricopeptide repeat protein n=1 Tax=Microbulbifer sp. MLAF003 TaxID=3032582 RepID=UPI0024AE7499|nr:tetratricopeptide repeat protein [Microbulbifer sp. MLAF003]WHI50613.1 tetratricopeptide repeat protein [Microbulbifer sp. MLAF003]